MPKDLRSGPDEHLLQRVRAEFLEMPGLHVTCQQAQRLWGLDHETCARLLGTLVDSRFLSRQSDGRYRRLTDER